MSDPSKPALWTPPWEWSPAAVRALMRVRGDSAHTLAAAAYVCDRAVQSWIYDGRSPGPGSAKELYRLWAELEPWQREVFDALRANPQTGKEPPLDRRQAAVVIPAVLAAAWERIAAEWRFPVDAGLVAAYEESTDAYAAKHETADPRVLGPEVAAHADRLLRLLDRGMSDALRTRVYVVTVGTHVQAGSLAFHSADRAVARRYLAAATHVAAESGAPALHAQALNAEEILYNPWPSGGRGGNPGRALELLDQAADLATGHADGVTLARIAVGRAEEALALHKAPISQAALADAQRALDAGGGPQQGLFTLSGLYAGTDAWLERARAKVDAAAGHYDAAERTLTSLFARDLARGHARADAITVANIGAVRRDAGDPEGACDMLGDGLDRATRAGYPIGVERIRGVRGAFPPEWAPLACVRDLDEQIRLALAWFAGVIHRSPGTPAEGP